MKNIIIATKYNEDLENWKSVIASDKKYAKLSKQIIFCVGSYAKLKSKHNPEDIRVIIASIFLEEHYSVNFGEVFHEFTGYTAKPVPILFSSMTEHSKEYGVSGMYIVPKNDDNRKALCDILVEFDLEKVKDLKLFEEKLKKDYKQELMIGV